MSEILYLAKDVYAYYLSLVFTIVFIGLNLSLILNAKLYLKEDVKQNDLKKVFKHFIDKHLVFMFVCLVGYIISVFFAYDFDAKNPFYMPICTVSISFFVFICANFIHIVARSYIIKKNIAKDEAVVCAENFVIIIYCFACLNVLIYFSILFLNMLLFRI